MIVYNSSNRNYYYITIEGASQLHRHMQLIPLDQLWKLRNPGKHTYNTFLIILILRIASQILTQFKIWDAVRVHFVIKDKNFSFHLYQLLCNS